MKYCEDFVKGFLKELKVNLYADVREYVIKAQILAGGRGKGVFDNGFQGGVHLTKEFVFKNFLNLSTCFY